jgi:hypothetical protein
MHSSQQQHYWIEHLGTPGFDFNNNIMLNHLRGLVRLELVAVLLACVSQGQPTSSSTSPSATLQWHDTRFHYNQLLRPQ